ncbi:hypothetical protein Dimus_038788 [Dionaea muscipula]
MVDGKCSKRYPKPFVDVTTMDGDGYPIYRRRAGPTHSDERGYMLDNSNVVPYSPHLSRMFNCHINVEVCSSVQCVKYIHKYVYKGHDMATMVLEGVDEIKQYLNARYIGPPEAAWRLFGNSMHEENPSVMRLALHLPGEHRVLFNPEEDMDAIVARGQNERTTLTGFLNRRSNNEYARAFTYQQFSEKFVWHADQKHWTERQRGFAIGRLYFATPSSGERFYLRLLLTIVKGPQSFEHLRTVDNFLHPTFQRACLALGLLENDDEWVQCMQEAVIMQTGGQLRRLFTTILSQCDPTDPLALWNQFSVHICDDLAHNLRTVFGIHAPTDAQIKDYGLFLVEQLLQDLGETLAKFTTMPQPTGTWASPVHNRYKFEHQRLIVDAQSADVEYDIARLNDGQRNAYNAVTGSFLHMYIFNSHIYIFHLYVSF